jgi:predicted RNase H-like HicB family nuclease
MNNELIFLVEEAVEGGFSARALGESIFTDAETLAELRENIKDAVLCHFDEGQASQIILTNRI